MKIFDCVTFFEENRQMNLRFNILDNYVDQFVVCEGKYDHQGRKKKINFNVNNYKKFKKKITHVIVENFPKNLDPWERQAFQREQILKNINQAKEDVTNLGIKKDKHYDNSKGSIYEFCENQKLNAYEFDIIKRITRCRKKGNFEEDLQKTKRVIDLYLKECNLEGN